jgi:hypothetical protein
LAPSGDLASRLSVASSGWFHEAAGARRQLIVGDADALVASLFKSSPKRHFGIAVSSVLPGLCLGPALNLAVDAMVSRHLHGVDGRTLVRTDDRIAVVSRSHSLRDYLAESTLRFGREAFPFMSFPTFRLKRSGEGEPARFGRDGNRSRVEAFTESPRFLFYDLSPLNGLDSVPECAIVLAELAESDGPKYIERLLTFARACHARFVFPIVSYHDAEKRRVLAEHGFTIVTVTKGAGTAEPDFTFSALGAATPATSRLTVISCDDPSAAALAIDQAYRMLRDMWRICGNQQPMQLRRAWNLLDEMTASPAFIMTLETVRRDAPGITTITFALNKLTYLDCTALPAHVQASLNLRWPHLCEMLSDIYKMLCSRNPVAEKVVERISDADGPLTVMTRSDTAAQALQRDLIFSWGWKDDGSVRIGSTPALCRARIVARNVLAVGFNPTFRPQLYWSVLPSNLEVVTYPHGLSALAEYQALLRQSIVRVLPKANVDVLLPLRGASNVNVTKAPVFDLDYADLSAPIAAFSTLRRTAAALTKDDPSALVTEDEVAFADIEAAERERDLDSEPTAATEEQEAEGPYIVMHFVGGGEHRAPLNAPFAVLPADSEELVRLQATELSQGDRIVLLSEEEHKSVYALIAERTKHLFPMDDRALDLWDTAMELVRAEYPPRDPIAVEAFCKRLEDDRCGRGRQSMRNWLNGRTHAPEAPEDVGILLRVAGTPGDAVALAKIVSTELDQYRNFRRSIGRAIVRRTVTRAGGRPSRSRLDEEIDEALELCDVREIESVDIIEPAAPAAGLESS